MKPETVQDWIENGVPCLACGERVMCRVAIGKNPGEIAFTGQCDPCAVSPIGVNPMMLILS
jgi:hypothetical protein